MRVEHRYDPITHQQPRFSKLEINPQDPLDRDKIRHVILQYPSPNLPHAKVKLVSLRKEKSDGKLAKTEQCASGKIKYENSYP